MNQQQQTILKVLSMSAQIDQGFTKALSAIHGISLREVMLMLFVKQAAGSKLSRIDLAKKLAVSPATVTRATLPLEKIGLIDREADPRDARLSYVVLTKTGKKILGHAEKTLDQQSTDFLSRSLSEKEQRSLASILSKLTR